MLFKPLVLLIGLFGRRQAAAPVAAARATQPETAVVATALAEGLSQIEAAVAPKRLAERLAAIEEPTAQIEDTSDGSASDTHLAVASALCAIESAMPAGSSSDEAPKPYTGCYEPYVPTLPAAELAPQPEAPLPNGGEPVTLQTMVVVVPVRPAAEAQNTADVGQAEPHAPAASGSVSELQRIDSVPPPALEVAAPDVARLATDPLPAIDPADQRVGMLLLPEPAAEAIANGEPGQTVDAAAATLAAAEAQAPSAAEVTKVTGPAPETAAACIDAKTGDSAGRLEAEVVIANPSGPAPSSIADDAAEAAAQLEEIMAASATGREADALEALIDAAAALAQEPQKRTPRAAVRPGQSSLSARLHAVRQTMRPRQSVPTRKRVAGITTALPAATAPASTVLARQAELRTQPIIEDSTPPATQAVEFIPAWHTAVA